MAARDAKAPGGAGWLQLRQRLEDMEQEADEAAKGLPSLSPDTIEALPREGLSRAAKAAGLPDTGTDEELRGAVLAWMLRGGLPACLPPGGGMWAMAVSLCPPEQGGELEAAVGALLRRRPAAGAELALWNAVLSVYAEGEGADGRNPERAVAAFNALRRRGSPEPDVATYNALIAAAPAEAGAAWLEMRKAKVYPDVRLAARLLRLLPAGESDRLIAATEQNARKAGKAVSPEALAALRRYAAKRASEAGPA